MSDRKKAALVACSDPLTEKQAEEIRVLEGRLREEGVAAEMIQGFFERGYIDPKQKGKLLTDCFRDKELDYVFFFFC